MNWPWNKKKDKQEEITIPEIPHEHTWKDMPWYMTEKYSEKQKTAEYEIVEPFICITCGSRQNVVLESQYYAGLEREDRKRIFNEVKKTYKQYLKPRAVVEDMINNILLVKDAHHLAMLEKMRGIPHSGCGTSTNMEPLLEEEEDKVPKIEGV